MQEYVYELEENEYKALHRVANAAKEIADAIRGEDGSRKTTALMELDDALGDCEKEFGEGEFSRFVEVKDCNPIHEEENHDAYGTKLEKEEPTKEEEEFSHSNEVSNDEGGE